MIMSSKTMKVIDEGWVHIKAREIDEAEHDFLEASQADPSATDAWNGLGAVHFERGELELSLANYRKARATALVRYGGEFPDRLSWTDEHKPALRAIQGMGLNYFRMGKLAEAEELFEALLELNPLDNQGAAFMLRDIKKKARLWKNNGKQRL